ncbi:hypothetical protein [Nonomuraea endophytica]|uniref:HEAT repeat domain-containing protein n=1 Tax=Nonomuraea endophytica TaxID=714136 RepID=A0A7W8A9V4_9ACTN|nr:hypothetical protein [Nonomuraea endophytica]MBB5081709.1 hypothetical protein [Nonomuraea endophytica]
MIEYDDPASFRGQLQRGRGAAARRAPTEPGAADAVYECVVTDTRWDRQVEQRDSYLARLITRLALPLAPIEQHLSSHNDEDDEPVELALQVLALLPMIGRLDAVAVLRRYATEGPHWATALEAISTSGAMKLPAIWCDTEPWTTFARSQPRIRRIVDQRKSSQARPHHSQKSTTYETEDLMRLVAAGGPERRQALEELGRRGDRTVLDLAEDSALRNATGWTPGIAQALHHLGPAALPRARIWIAGDDNTLVALGERVLAEVGDRSDASQLLSALRRATTAGNWCAAEIPARGLGRLKIPEAATDLMAAWEDTVHSPAREAFLEALQGCAPHNADAVAAEALDDCEPTVQRRACEGVPDTTAVRSRLQELADDPLTPEIHEAANTKLLLLTKGL